MLIQEQLILKAKQQQRLLSRLKLTDTQADAGSTHGDDAGDLKRPAALWAHQAVFCLQTALGTTAPGAFALRDLVFLGLSLPRLLFIPLLTLASSHDALVCLTKSR